MTIDDIAATVRRAADAVPDSRSDLSTVLRRHRINKRRRTAVAVAAMVAVVAASGATVTLTQRHEQPQPPAQVQQTPESKAPETPAAKPQRLPLDVGWALGQDKNGGKVTVYDVRSMLEMRPDQRLVATPVPAVVDDVRSWVALDDGRFVVLGGKDLKPGVQRQDGPDVTDYAIRLLVLTPDGRITQQREVRVQGQDVELIGATATTAYLYRTPGRIVAHDLQTGAEQPLSALNSVPDRATTRLSVQGGLLFSVPEQSCDLTATELATGRKLFTVHLPGLPEWSCRTAWPARLSPDGRTLAMAVKGGDDEQATVSLLKIDVATGKVTPFPVSGGPVSKELRPGPLGVGWLGGTVRVAWVRMPSPGVHPLSESIQVTDIG
ncbi:hypothetical protein ACFPIJ_04305 [Dactylosporangium cerinum]|uniref:Lipoprotein LpqB beta-propeller domain-containing protein n=1 Tax=Dactylosporangium cerinum TaxID=1434730 RepID=A0ABV9VMQ7_9ACTN